MTLTHAVALPDSGVLVVLRPARIADAYLAAELVAVPGAAAEPGGMSTQQRVAYQVQLDDMAVLAQIVSVDGELFVPGTETLPELVDTLSPDDMALLRDAAEVLKKKRRAGKVQSGNGGPSSALSSSADGTLTTSATPT